MVSLPPWLHLKITFSQNMVIWKFRSPTKHLRIFWLYECQKLLGLCIQGIPNSSTNLPISQGVEKHRLPWVFPTLRSRFGGLGIKKLLQETAPKNGDDVVTWKSWRLIVYTQIWGTNFDWVKNSGSAKTGGPIIVVRDRPTFSAPNYDHIFKKKTTLWSNLTYQKLENGSFWRFFKGN